MIEQSFLFNIKLIDEFYSNLHKKCKNIKDYVQKCRM